MNNREELSRTERLLEAIRLAQTNFILEASTGSAFMLLLDELLELTDSQYGFIGEVELNANDAQVLRVRAYTDIAWNEETRQLLRENAATGLVFDNLDTLFGHAIVSEQVVIANDAKNHPMARGIPDGHPPLNSFLGIPFHHGNKLTGLIGLANCPKGYSHEVVEFLEPLVATCGILAYSWRMSEEQKRADFLQEQAERTQQLVEFSQKLAHDLNNLLTVTLTTADTSLISEPPSMAREDIERIQLATTRAAELTEKILSVAGNSSISRKPVRVASVLGEVQTICLPIIRENIDLQIVAEENLPFVLADPLSLQQALTNLVFNSAEALQDSAGIVCIRVETYGEGKLKVEVEDDGCGMDEVTQKRAFDPYFSTKSGSRGFGLSSVLGFVNSHGGDLRVVSEPGRGTRVQMILPASQPSSDAFTKGPSFQFAGKTLLVVDDESTVRSAICRLLATTQAHLMEAASAFEAMKLLEQNSRSIDVLLLDIVMPEMDGLELCHWMRAQDMNIPTVLMTGHVTRNIPQEIGASPSATFLRKPFSIGQLKEACATLFSKSG